MTRKHRGFFLTTPEGVHAYVIGDPNMDQKTKDALHTVIQTAYKKFTMGLDNKYLVIRVPEGDSERIQRNVSDGDVSERTERIRRNQRGEP